METDLKANFKADFKVRVGQFEGPLELLLDLIEKKKLHISDISLSDVADEFIEHLNSFEEFPMMDSADFILIASTLLLIKSRSLLPNLTLTEEEEVNIEDLENRLALYKKYKDLALNLEKMFGNFLYFARERKQMNIIFAPTREITLLSLKNSLDQTLQNMPQDRQALPKIVVTKIINLEEMIEKLSLRINNSLKISFKSFALSEKVDKINLIVGFLAMLELVKRGTIRVNQENHFEDISMESEYLDTPKY